MQTALVYRNFFLLYSFLNGLNFDNVKDMSWFLTDTVIIQSCSSESRHCKVTQSLILTRKLNTNNGLYRRHHLTYFVTYEYWFLTKVAMENSEAKRQRLKQRPDTGALRNMCIVFIMDLFCLNRIVRIISQP